MFPQVKRPVPIWRAGSHPERGDEEKYPLFPWRKYNLTLAIRNKSPTWVITVYNDDNLQQP
jgi:hypothetical protein